MADLVRVPTTNEILEKFDKYAIHIAELDEYYIAFEVAEIIDETIYPPLAGLWIFESDTTDFSAAQKCLKGSIKWDGCSNWDYCTDETLAHYCGRKDALSFSLLMNRLYDIAAERIKHYDKECAER